MINPPKTLDEAHRYRYGAYGSYDGKSYKEGQCAQAVWTAGPGALEYQCPRKSGYSLSGLYCKQHDPERVKDRAAKRDAARIALRNRERILCDLIAVNRTADLLRAKSKIGPAEACEAFARDIRKKLDEVK